MAKPELKDAALLEALEHYPLSACEAFDDLKPHTVSGKNNLCIECGRRLARVEDEASPFDWELHAAEL